MILPISFRLARNSLRAHRTRTVLTTLGVIIGSFIISLVLIIGSSLHKSIREQAINLENDLILVRGQHSGSAGIDIFSPFKFPAISSLTERDIVEISELGNVQSYSPMMFLFGQARHRETTIENVSTVATNDGFQNIMDLETISGNWLDEESSRAQVVLGERLALRLIGSNEALNQNVTIKGQNFIVIGIVRTVDQSAAIAGVDINSVAFISLSNGIKFNSGLAQIGQVLIEPNENNPDIFEEIAAILNRNHLNSDSFVISSAKDMSEFAVNWLWTIMIVALIFAGISLVVGGIGIMNIMLVSVVERIREIGIRKAVGATKRQICEQFLLEALIMAFIGGLIGLVLAYLVGYLIGLQFTLTLAFDWWIFVIGLSAPIIIGVIFGLAPAVRASNYDPIIALRQYH